MSKKIETTETVETIVEEVETPVVEPEVEEEDNTPEDEAPPLVVEPVVEEDVETSEDITILEEADIEADPTLTDADKKKLMSVNRANKKLKEKLAKFEEDLSKKTSEADENKTAAEELKTLKLENTKLKLKSTYGLSDDQLDTLRGQTEEELTEEVEKISRAWGKGIVGNVSNGSYKPANSGDWDVNASYAEKLAKIKSVPSWNR